MHYSWHQGELLAHKWVIHHFIESKTEKGTSTPYLESSNQLVKTVVMSMAEVSKFDTYPISLANEPDPQLGG